MRNARPRIVSALGGGPWPGRRGAWWATFGRLSPPRPVCIGLAICTVTLAAEGMRPVTVKKTLRKVPGVVARYEGEGIGGAKVTFDPAKARGEDSTAATAWAGDPSRVKE